MTLEPYDIYTKQFGLSPTLGFNYPLGYRFSVSMELSIRWIYYTNNDREKPNASDNNKWQNNIFFNPLQLLSVNYHF